MNNTWKPCSDNKILRQRSEYIGKIRQFFNTREILEVETPCLAKDTVTDPYIDAINVNTQYGKKFLQTSPEYFMKRLLANGSDSIFQICKCFRDDPISERHNPEFTMLEWYHEVITYKELMIEISELIISLAPDYKFEYYSYLEIFKSRLNINPLNITDTELKEFTLNKIGCIQGLENPNRIESLDLLFSYFIEPTLNEKNVATFIYNYPIEQAALAKQTKEQGHQVAERFELFMNGIEIANGYGECLDPDVLLQRFNEDNDIRKTLNKLETSIDEEFISAHRHGLKSCSGVALGLDRLLMVLMGINSIDKVISFR
jgi:lysyl-tRNA synthetase class 2